MVLGVCCLVCVWLVGLISVSLVLVLLMFRMMVVCVCGFKSVVLCDGRCLC